MADELTSVISYTAPRPARSPAYLHTTCIRHVGGSAPLPVVRTRATPGIVGAERLERAAPLPGNSGVARALHRPAERDRDRGRRRGLVPGWCELAGGLVDPERHDGVPVLVPRQKQAAGRIDVEAAREAVARPEGAERRRPADH